MMGVRNNIGPRTAPGKLLVLLLTNKLGANTALFDISGLCKDVFPGNGLG